MSNISIVVRRSSDQLRQRLERKSASFKKLPFRYSWSDCGDAGKMLEFVPDRSADSASRETLVKTLASVLTGFITADLPAHLLRDLLRFHYFYFGREERREILSRARRRFEGGALYRRPGFYRGSIERYLRANLCGSPVHLNIEGFYNFRMYSLQRELRQALDDAVDVLVAEREYREFMRLLKYFLHLQQPKIELIHLSVDLQGRLQIMDRCFKRIDPLEWEELRAADFDELSDYEDIFVSMLVSLAPRRIMLHRSVISRYPRVTKSLRSIFESRLITCKNCAYCHRGEIHLVGDDSERRPGTP